MACSEQPSVPGSAKLVLVTGAARRIGRHIALSMAQKGWDVAVHFCTSEAEGHSVVSQIRDLGRRAEAFSCDLADEGATRELLPRVISRMGHVTCVVNNASAFQLDSAGTFSYELLTRHMHVNVGAPVLLAQSLFSATPNGQQSCIINILDQKLYNLNPDFLSYTLSKSALQCATMTLAQALAPKVRVAGVAPGYTMVNSSHGHTGAQLEASQKLSLLGRTSTPEDIARAVLFLAESPAVTGTTLIVDGGQHLVPMDRDFLFMV